MQNTSSDRFGQTDYNLSEHHERPAFQKGSGTQQNERDGNDERDQSRQPLNADQDVNGGLFSFEGRDQAHDSQRQIQTQQPLVGGHRTQG
jgi:hypothetical protein